MPPRPAIHVIVLLLGALPTVVAAQQQPPIRFGLTAAAAEVRPGGTVALALTARIPRGWHLYGMQQPADGPVPTTVEVGPAALFGLAGPVTSSPPHRAFDPNFGVALEWHDDPASFRIPLRAARTALPGTYDAEVRISYQRCNDRLCLPLTTDTVRTPLSIAGAPEPLQATSSPPASGGSGPAAREPGAPGEAVGSPAAAEPGPAAPASDARVQETSDSAGAPPAPDPGLRPNPLVRWAPLAAALLVAGALAIVVPSRRRRPR